MKFRAAHHDQGHHGMNLVPLIDVLLILLIFFIVTMSSARRETELTVSVPAADKSAEAKRQVGELVVNVRKDGTIILNKMTLGEDQLFTRLSDIARTDKKRAVIIRGDKVAQFDHIVKVLSVIHRSGLYNVSFATVEPEKQGP